MIIVKNTLDLPPDAAGELLREYCFIGQGFGCYDNFDLRPEFVKCEPSNLIKELCVGYNLENLDMTWGESSEGYLNDIERIHCYLNGGLIVAWLCDGDTTLVFQEGDRVIFNGDAKKSYGWEEAK